MSEPLLRLNCLSRGGRRAYAKRVGRGMSSTHGKTCGRGHKGQKARAGGFHKVGFEGGQMPLQRRLPKSGFRSRLAATRCQLRLHELMSVKLDGCAVIDPQALIARGLIPARTKKVKVIMAGNVTKSVTVRGLHFTAAAQRAFAEADGRVVN